MIGKMARTLLRYNLKKLKMEATPMKIYEVTDLQKALMYKLFHGFIFRQTRNGKHYVKVSKGQEKRILEQLSIKLVNPVTLD
jgi:hypothetical protein